MTAIPVLIAAPDSDYRLLLCLALAPDERFAVVAETAATDDLADAAAASGAEVAVIDCDWNGAFAALPQLRAAQPQCRVVLLSGYGERDLRLASEVVGAVGYLRKDVAASRLGDELADLVAVIDVVQQVLLDPDLRNAGVARRFVDAALEGWGLAEVSEVVKLLVSELVTNAIVHARTQVDVAVKLTPGAARVEVSDRSETAPEARAVTTEDESGRGLGFVETLARAWGVHPRPGGGKTIWFEVERPGVPVNG